MSFQAVSGRLKLCPGPVRDTATILEECTGGEVTGEFLLDQIPTQLTLTTKSRGEEIKDAGVGLHIGDFSQGMGLKLNQGAGFEIVAMREGDSTGASLSMSSRDEVMLGGAKGFQIGMGLTHTSRFISSDDPSAPNWELTHTFVLRWSAVGGYPAKTSLTYEAANILARSMHSIRMNRIVNDAIGVPGTRNKGRLLLFAANPMYDIPIILSTQGLLEGAESPYNGLSAALLGGVGLYQLIHGTLDDDLGQQGLGMALTTATVHGLPTLLSRDKDASIWARIALVGTTTVGLTIAGVYLLKEDDNPAEAYRVLSFDINQLIAGVYHLVLGP